MLSPYRRHLASCAHASKGTSFTRCTCPCWVYGDLPGGETVRKSLKTTDWQRALRIVEHMEAGEIKVKPIGRHTIAGGVEEFVKDCGRRGLSPRTIVSYRLTFRHLIKAFGERYVGDITVEEMSAWCAGRVGKDQQPITPRSAVKELEHVRALYRFFVDREWCDRNPAVKVRPPKVPRYPATMPFTPVEVRKILAAADEFGPAHQRKETAPRMRALVLLLLHSGLRISDVARLTRDRIDWKSRYLTVRQEKTGTPVRIKLSEEVIGALDVLPQSMFRQGDGAFSTIERTLQRSLTRLGAKVKIHVHPHRFRDTFAVQLLSQGADIRTVQLLLGHDSVKTTEKHYAHFVKEHQARLDAATALLDYTTAQPVALPAAI